MLKWFENAVCMKFEGMKELSRKESLRYLSSVANGSIKVIYREFDEYEVARDYSGRITMVRKHIIEEFEKNGKSWRVHRLSTEGGKGVGLASSLENRRCYIERI